MPNHRPERVGHSMRSVIAELLLREIKDPRVAMVTVSAVDVSPDLRNARVFVSFMGDEARRESALAGLRSASGFIRAQVTRRLHLRYAPEIRFCADDSFDQRERVDKLLRGEQGED